MKVRKWTIRMAVVGLGGLGAMLFSERGRKLIRSADRLSGATGRLAAWNDAAQRELDHIQDAVIELEQSLGTHTAH